MRMGKKLLVHEKVIVRKSTFNDIDRLVGLSKIGFPGMDPFEASHLESHLQIFPEGQYCIEYDKRVIGSCSTMILNFSDYSQEDNFKKITDDGYIRNHNPIGMNLYGVDVVIHPNYRDLKLGSKLYEVRRNLCKSMNLKSIIFGGRIPQYYQYSNQMAVEKYVSEVEKENIYDPTLTFQLNQGFILKGIISNYLPDDAKSLKYAALLEWENPHYSFNTYDIL